MKRLTCIHFAADIMGHPDESHTISNDDSQILFGEQFEVEEERGAYVYGTNLTDGYKGCIERVYLALDIPKATHAVTNLTAHLYPEPNFKSRPELLAPYMGRISCENETNNGFLRTHDHFWIHENHVQEVAKTTSNKDLADTALQFLGTPYLFAGRTAMGIDCSALVQLSLMAMGQKCPPRDTKDQMHNIGKDVTGTPPKRNDIVYYKGHVGIMIDDKKILNATARHMKTLIEPIEDLTAEYGDILGICRL